MEAAHILVSFIEEDGEPTAIVPLKRINDCPLEELQEGVVCEVEWSNKKTYPARVLATGMYLHFFLLVL